MADKKDNVSVVFTEEAAKNLVFSGEPQTFGGFPGVYAVGEPVALGTLGLTEKEAKAKIKEMNLPLELTSEPGSYPEPEPIWALVNEAEVEPGQPIPIVPNAHIASGAELPFEVESAGHGMAVKDRKKMVSEFLGGAVQSEAEAAEAAANVVAEHGGQV